MLRQEPLVALVPQSQSHQEPLDLLRTQPFIRYDRSLGGGKHADRFLRQHGIEPAERFELSSLLAIAMMVHEGLGVSLVPDIGSPLTAGLRVASLRVDDSGEARRFGVLWQRGSPKSQLISAFLQQTQSQA
ncbi:LysR substrate-binding domain-containing protein [Ramlibacter sp. MAHUQ-53]|uniref:LysR substrate-binding domain-containing protein n=1 Tax=unclassified Ramlibacter TaxID=2617605 RepID=UPI00362E65BE